MAIKTYEFIVVRYGCSEIVHVSAETAALASRKMFELYPNAQITLLSHT